MKNLVIGMGTTGLSVAKYWRHCGLAVTAVDDRPHPPHHPAFTALLGADNCHKQCAFGQWQPEDFTHYAQIAISPGIDPATLKVDKNRCCNDATLFSAHWQRHYAHSAYLLAVTGTNGKSTTVSLAHHVAQEAGYRSDAIGNIGKAMLDAVLEWGQVPPAIVSVELSSFQLEIASDFYSDVAVVLNVSDDHLDRHHSTQRCADIKRNIYNGTQKILLNIDNPYTRDYLGTLPDIPVTTLSLADPAADWHSDNHHHIYHARQKVVDGSQLSHACRQHPLSSLAVAAALPSHLSLTNQMFRHFSNRPHCQQLVGEHNGIRYINDSKATNVEAVLHSVAQIKTPIVWIAGGDSKGQDLTPLHNLKPQLRCAVLIGRDADAIQNAIAPLPCHRAESMADAVQTATAAAQPGDTVLLAPACASLDMFANFAERGRQFTQAVQMLTGGAL